jgi:hypothetical protein
MRRPFLTKQLKAKFMVLWSYTSHWPFTCDKLKKGYFVHLCAVLWIRINFFSDSDAEFVLSFSDSDSKTNILT